MQGFARVCLAVVTGFVLSWAGQAYAQAMSAEIEQAKANVISLIETESFDEANRAVELMLAEFAGRQGLGECLYEVADKYSDSRRYAEANDIYAVVIEQNQGSEIERKSLLGAATADILQLIESQDYWPAGQMLSQLQQRFKGHPDLADRLYSVARRYAWNRKYKEAKGLLERLLREYPGSTYRNDWQFWLRRVGICLLINEGRDTQADAAIEAFLKDFSERADLAEVFYWICREYEWTRNRVEDRRTRYDVCIAWYDRLAKDFSGSEFADKAALDAKRLAHRTRIFTSIEDGNDAEVDAVVDAMVRDLNGCPDAASELYWTGIEYELYEGGQRLAKRMFERIVDKYGDSPEVENARVCALRMDILDMIEAGDINNAEPAIDRMVRDFKNHPHVYESLCRIAKVYYEIAQGTTPVKLRINAEQRERIVTERRKYFALARNVWQRIIDELDAKSPDTAVAYYFVGSCRRYMSEYDKAIENFEVVVRDWPDYEHAGNAQCSIAWCYEGMERTGRLSEAQSQRLIEQAYRDAVEKFRDSYWAKYAALKLAKKYDRTGQAGAAVEYYRVFLDLAEPDDSDIPYVMGRIEKLTGTGAQEN